ncbi:MAG: bifunctional nuclease family protein [Candidatus Hydrothermarchaeota archaeon]
MEDYIQVKVYGVFPAGSVNEPAPVVLLEDNHERFLPIFVGIPEAVAIQSALEGITSPRPTTHELFVSVLDEIGSGIKRILIDDINEGIYFARLTIEVNGITKEVDARPSDCIALALRVNAPIYVSENVMEEASIDKDKIFIGEPE